MCTNSYVPRQLCWLIQLLHHTQWTGRVGRDSSSLMEGNQPWHKPLRSHGKRVEPGEGTHRNVLCACESGAHNPPVLVWYLLKEDSYCFCPLLSFSFPLQTGFSRLRCYPELNLSRKLDVLKQQTLVECSLCVKPILATRPDILF